LEIGFGHHGKNDNNWFQSPSNLLTMEKIIFNHHQSNNGWKKWDSILVLHKHHKGKNTICMYVCMYVCKLLNPNEKIRAHKIRLTWDCIW
jgi:hypothetical protein